jgi:hypothetical protein
VTEAAWLTSDETLGLIKCHVEEQILERLAGALECVGDLYAHKHSANLSSGGFFKIVVRPRLDHTVTPVEVNGSMELKLQQDTISVRKQAPFDRPYVIAFINAHCYPRKCRE